MPPPPPPAAGQYGGQGGQPARTRAKLLVYAAVALVVGAIGVGLFFVISNGGDDQRQEYIDALASREAPEGAALSLSEDEIRCMAEVQVDVVGVDRLAERYTPEELRDLIQEDADFDLDLGDPTEEEAEQVVDGMDRCWDFLETMRSQAADVPSATPEMSACISEALDDSFLRQAMIDDTMEREDTELGTTIAVRVQDQCGHLEQ